MIDKIQFIKDIIVSFISIMISTVAYFKSRNNFTRNRMIIKKAK
ncbi:hypothetical protein [Clostridium sp.]|nr:hypothetical protein [Clostridium sp.]